MAWTKEFDEILKGVLKRSGSHFLDAEEIDAVNDVITDGFELHKADTALNGVMRAARENDTLTEGEREVVQKALDISHKAIATEEAQCKRCCIPTFR